MLPLRRPFASLTIRSCRSRRFTSSVSFVATSHVAMADADEGEPPPRVSPRIACCRPRRFCCYGLTFDRRSLLSGAEREIYNQTKHTISSKQIKVCTHTNAYRWKEATNILFLKTMSTEGLVSTILTRNTHTHMHAHNNTSIHIIAGQYTEVSPHYAVGNIYTQIYAQYMQNNTQIHKSCTIHTQYIRTHTHRTYTNTLRAHTCTHYAHT
jgi:hypothetical protein